MKTLTELKADPNKDRLKNNPQALGQPIKPNDLGDVANAYWDSIVPDLERCGIVCERDTTALTELCNWYQTYVYLCNYKLNGQREDSVAAARIATQKKNAWEVVQKLLIQFGMTPLARNSINVTTKAVSSLTKYQQ